MKCEVLADAVTLTVGKGSIVDLSPRQYELARAYVKAIDTEDKKKTTKKKKKEE